ncbi:protein S-acyltransferase 10 isoform X2 [Vigna unguiculata]|uniref:protein S-acyltransferase 10 isoform X2 n=1 Tax=Vigna unguiculata TaxID=3917 RepID=UPI0010164117|nr:protein S-acyltransferase 10 isoform X2 [Vigna unguiculata]
MTIARMCSPMRTWERPIDRCFRTFPCLADPGRRSSLCLKLALVTIHIIYAGVLFLFDGDLIESTKTEPCYVVDAMMSVHDRNVAYKKTPDTSSQSASSRNGSFVVSMEGNLLGRSLSGSSKTAWSKLVADLYPLGSSIRTWTCTYCNAEQPPRAKHCHDCDKCVLQFDHHCVWLGNCIGQGNHCKFWWYLFEETALCLWTGVLYISYLKAHITRVWWQGAILILLLITLSVCLIFLLLLLLFHSYLILTNQTTFELVRRRRIHYLRGIPERVHPFSGGVRKNLYYFCCARSSVYRFEPMPTAQEIEEKSRPYTCSDVLTCRCC